MCSYLKENFSVTTIYATQQLIQGYQITLTKENFCFDFWGHATVTRSLNQKTGNIRNIDLAQWRGNI